MVAPLSKLYSVWTLNDSFECEVNTHLKIKIENWSIFMLVEWISVAHRCAALMLTVASFTDYCATVHTLFKFTIA